MSVEMVKSTPKEEEIENALSKNLFCFIINKRARKHIVIVLSFQMEGF